MATMNADLQKDIESYQRLQQQAQMLMMQRQQTDLQIAENERAVASIGKAASGTVYRLAGSVLVPREKDELEKELSEEADNLKMRKEVLAKQEDKLKQSLTAIVERVEKAAKLAEGKGDRTDLSG
jgi:prefoldin beta subunit